MSAATHVTVQDFMSKKPIHINEDDTISFVINMFERTRISGAPVINAKGEYVGVISKTDLASAKLLKYGKELETATAKLFMSKGKPLTLPADARLEMALDMMLEKHVHRLFVDDGTGEIVGVISSFDILRAIHREPAAPKAAPKAPPAASTPKTVQVAPDTFRPAEDPEPAEAKGEPAEVRTTKPREPEPEKKEKAVDKDKLAKDKEIEMRIFNLISRKQEQLMQQNKP